jgi:hypothetical protein
MRHRACMKKQKGLIAQPLRKRNSQNLALLVLSDATPEITQGQHAETQQTDRRTTIWR